MFSSEHPEIVLAHEEKFKNIDSRLNLFDVKSNEIIQLAKDIVAMRIELKTAIEETRKHIEAGSRWRMAIVCSCISLIGIAILGIVKFSVVDYKVSLHDIDIKEVRSQIYDLNYVRGKTEGMQEKGIQ